MTSTSRLWTPWRHQYVTRSEAGTSWPGVPHALRAYSDSGAERSECVFCNMIAAVDFAIAGGMEREQAELAAHLVAREALCFVCLNAYPYASGHLMVIPYRHVDSLAALTRDEAIEMMLLSQRVESSLRAAYSPAGLNFGLNLGEAAGAGIASHLHMHGLPRWVGDSNFMTAVADTRVLPEDLDTSWRRIRAVWGEA